jgi:hypothetical protein
MTTSETRPDPLRWAIVAAAAVVALLHVLGALQVREQVYRGYRSGSDRVIIEVTRGGPADRAGLRAGDRIVRIDDIDAGDSKALEARPRARVGQVQSIVIDRGGSNVEARLVLAGLPPLGVVAYLASGLTGLSFLGFGLWAYLHAPRRTSRPLAMAGIGLGAVFTEQPYVASPFASALQESGLIVAGVFGFAALLHFTLAFPKESRVLGRKATLVAIYLPAATVSVANVAAAFVQRGETGGAAALTTTLSLVLVLGYFALAIVMLVLSFLRATSAERSASGLNVLVGCMVLGLAPMVPTAVYLVAPRVVFPWSDYYDLTWLLIPFALARATVLQARNRPAGTLAREARPSSAADR